MKRYIVTHNTNALLPHVVIDIVSGAPVAMFGNIVHADEHATKLEREGPRESVEMIALRALHRACADLLFRLDEKNCLEYRAVSELLLVKDGDRA